MAEVSEVLQGLDRQDGWGQDLEVASHDLADVAQLRNGGGGGMQHRARWGRFKCQACEPGSVRAMHRRPADRSLTDVRCDATFAGGLGNRAGEAVAAVTGDRGREPQDARAHTNAPQGEGRRGCRHPQPGRVGTHLGSFDELVVLGGEPAEPGPPCL